MTQDRHFAFKKAQVEGFVKKEFQRYFGKGGPDFHPKAAAVHGARY